MDTTFKSELPEDDAYYDEDQPKKQWIEQYFGDLMSPSARGGLDVVDDEPNYYTRSVSQTGFRSCKSCGAAVQVDTFYDLELLNVHRAFHDRLGF